MDRSVMKVGAAAAAMLGAVLALVFNLLYPRAEEPGNVASMLDQAAAGGRWAITHYMLAWSLGLVLLGVVAISRSFVREPSVSWARAGLVFTIGGVALLFASIVLLGFSAPNALEGADAATAQAVGYVAGGLFLAAIGSFFGLVPLLFGAAVVTGDEYPGWLGWLAGVGGAVGRGGHRLPDLLRRVLGPDGHGAVPDRVAAVHRVDRDHGLPAVAEGFRSRASHHVRLRSPGHIGTGLEVRGEREVLLLDQDEDFVDRPGMLGELARAIANAGVNVDLIYATRGDPGRPRGPRGRAGARRGRPASPRRGPRPAAHAHSARVRRARRGARGAGRRPGGGPPGRSDFRGPQNPPPRSKAYPAGLSYVLAFPYDNVELSHRR
jgi:hypothetical protein